MSNQNPQRKQKRTRECFEVDSNMDCSGTCLNESTNMVIDTDKADPEQCLLCRRYVFHALEINFIIPYSSQPVALRPLCTPECQDIMLRSQSTTREQWMNYRHALFQTCARQVIVSDERYGEWFVNPYEVTQNMTAFIDRCRQDLDEFNRTTAHHDDMQRGVVTTTMEDAMRLLENANQELTKKQKTGNNMGNFST